MDRIDDLVADMTDGSISVNPVVVENAIASGQPEFLLAMMGAGYHVDEDQILEAFINAIDNRDEDVVIELLDHENTSILGRESLKTILHYALDSEKYDIANHILETTSITVPTSYLMGLIERLDLTTLQMYVDETTPQETVQELIDYTLQLSEQFDNSDEIVDILTYLEDLL